MGVLVHAVQGRALLRGAVIREQGVRIAVQRMAGITFHHDSRLPRQAELCHQGVQIGGLVVDVGGQQHLAALVQVVLQHGHLVHQSVIRRKIRRGCVDDQQAAILRDLAGQQIQRLQGDVLGVQRLGEGAGQGLFPMVRGIVGHPGVAAGEFIDGGCDLLLATKGHIGTASGVIVGVVILVQIGRHSAPRCPPRWSRSGFRWMHFRPRTAPQRWGKGSGPSAPNGYGCFRRRNGPTAS